MLREETYFVNRLLQFAVFEGRTVWDICTGVGRQGGESSGLRLLPLF